VKKNNLYGLSIEGPFFLKKKKSSDNLEEHFSGEKSETISFVYINLIFLQDGQKG